MDGTRSIDISEAGFVFAEESTFGGLGDVPRLIQVAGSSLFLVVDLAASSLPAADSPRLLRTAAGKWEL